MIFLDLMIVQFNRRNHYRTNTRNIDTEFILARSFDELYSVMLNLESEKV